MRKVRANCFSQADWDQENQKHSAINKNCTDEFTII